MWQVFNQPPSYLSDKIVKQRLCFAYLFIAFWLAEDRLIGAVFLFSKRDSENILKKRQER